MVETLCRALFISSLCLPMVLKPGCSPIMRIDNQTIKNLHPKIDRTPEKKSPVLPQATTKQGREDIADSETWITVFVHGIMSVKPHFSCGNCIRFILDRVQGTTYARTVEIIRQDPIFYQNQAMQEIGFKKIDTSTVQKN